MKKKITYIANDGTDYPTAKECAAHETICSLTAKVANDPNYSRDMSAKDLAALLVNLIGDFRAPRAISVCIEEQLNASPDQVFRAKDFEHLGKMTTVRSQLSRLVKEGRALKVQPCGYRTCGLEED